MVGVLEKLGSKILGLGRRLDRNPRRMAHAEWVRIEGDRTLRVDYPIDHEATVVDIGGYRGDWASEIYSRYRCRIHVVEPVPQFAALVRARFERNPDVIVHELALGRENGATRMLIDNDRSQVGIGGEGPLVRTVSAGLFLDQLGTEMIDLMKINIEGAEYELVDALSEAGWLSRIRDVQVQFHDFVPNAEARLERATAILSKTHRRTYSYKFVWDNWRLLES